MVYRWIVFLLISVCFSAANAAIDVREFDNDVDRQRYQSFVDEMRCPKCQNQNLSGSDSPIANDLRRELYTMIQDGRSDKEIVDFMVDRYGEYILYRPRLTPFTVMLWVGPAVLLILGIIILIVMVRRRRANATEPSQALSTQEQARLKALFETQQSNARFIEPNAGEQPGKKGSSL